MRGQTMGILTIVSIIGVIFMLTVGYIMLGQLKSTAEVMALDTDTLTAVDDSVDRGCGSLIFVVCFCLFFWFCVFVFFVFCLLFVWFGLESNNLLFCFDVLYVVCFFCLFFFSLFVFFFV